MRPEIPRGSAEKSAHRAAACSSVPSQCRSSAARVGSAASEVPDDPPHSELSPPQRRRRRRDGDRDELHHGAAADRPVGDGPRRAGDADRGERGPRGRAHGRPGHDHQADGLADADQGDDLAEPDAGSERPSRRDAVPLRIGAEPAHLRGCESDLHVPRQPARGQRRGHRAVPGGERAAFQRTRADPGHRIERRPAQDEMPLDDARPRAADHGGVHRPVADAVDDTFTINATMPVNNP